MLALVAAPLAGDAQSGRVSRIGILARGAPDVRSFAAFHDALQERGQVEGQTYVLEPRYSEGSTERLRELASDLVRSHVDVIFAPHGAAAAAAKAVAPAIPVVFIAQDPIADGLVTTYSRPGGHLTGFAVPLEALATKWMEILRETIAALSRVAVIYIPDSRGSLAQLDGFKGAAAALALEILPLPVRGERDIETAFTTAARQRVGAITQIASPFFQASRMVELAARHRLPAIYDTRGFVEAGGLMSYGADVNLVFRQAAIYVDKILKGAKPADLPVEQPTKFELVINLKTAKALGLTIPQSVLLRADEVIACPDKAGVSSGC
jgi:putative ABC transport system substrate-binding protein